MNGTIDYSVLENEQLAKLESGSRANVLFKPSKKMKKRRQLDALVSNGKKLPRRKQSGHELLRSSDSDSSEVEEFSVLESQKWTKKWPSPGCCSTCYTLTCIVVVATCVLACAALIWMHLQLKHDFKQLKDRVDLVENKNAGTPGEFQALQSKLLSINKTVNDFKTGKYGLQDLNRTIVSMQKQITSLTAAAAELQKTVQQSEPNSNAKKNQAVANTVADLGANLQLAQADVESLKSSRKSFASQLQDLASRVLKLESSGGREQGSSGSDSPSLQDLLSQLNATFTRSMGLALANLDKQQSQLDAVDKFTQDVDKQLKNVSQVVTSLTETQQHLSDLVTSQQGKSSHPTEGGSSKEGQPQTETPLAQLQGQVHHLQSVLDQMQSEGQKWNASGKAANSSEVSANSLALQSLMKDHEDFVVFKTEVFQDLNHFNSSLGQMNVSVDVLNKDVEELFTKLGLAMTDITNITTVVEGLTRFLQTQQNHSKSVSSSETAQSLQINAAGTTTKPVVEQTPSSSGPEKSGNGTSPAEGATPGKSPSSARHSDVEPDSEGMETSEVTPEEHAAGSLVDEATRNNELNGRGEPSETGVSPEGTETDSTDLGM